MQVETLGTPIPAPPGFPVEWESPEDAHRLWERELQHIPKQATALDWDLQRRLIDNGFNAALERYDAPVRNAYRRLNTYVYQSIAPISHDPAVLQELGGRMQGHMQGLLGRQLEVWEGESLPRIKEHLGFWESFDLAGARREALAAHVDETVQRFEDAWAIHFRTVFPVILGMSLFDDFHREALGGEDAFAAFRLLQGLDNLSLEADRALYALSRRAAASPTVRQLVETTPAAEVAAALGARPEGRAFRAELEAYLDRYGRRHDGYITFSEPTWIEDPTVVIENLKDYLAQPERDPEAELAALAAKRERLIAEARAAVAGRDSGLAGQFEFLLKGAQESSIMQENHNFWIDGRVNHAVRRVFLEVGRRLAADGTIAAPEDVFHVSVAEARDALATGSGDLRTVVAGRKTELERWAGVQAPPVLGTLPPGPPPDDPVARAIVKMFGGIPREAPAENVVTGMPGSPGTVRGRARLVRSLADAGRLEQGDVLVTETTSPPWTPLFATAAAVVTDTGGILSHAGVVAREYGIPAVLGTKLGSQVIPDGALVEVDGGEGLVRILEA